MRRIMVWLTLCVLLIASQAVEAQSNPDTWPITEHCVGEATKPPKDWHFDGTLLLSSLSGSFERLHTYEQGWDTPRIQVVYSTDIPSSGQLSLDGKWFATVNGRSEDIEVTTSWNTDMIIVYSTEKDEKFTVEWISHFSAVHSLYGHGLYWLDNEHILYSKEDEHSEAWYIINPFTREIEKLQSKFTSPEFNFVFSPDRLKMLSNSWGDQFWTLSNGKNETSLSIVGNSFWSPDSSRFAAYTLQAKGNDADRLEIYDSVGNRFDTIFDFSPVSGIIWSMKHTWSSDGHYLLFATDHLYLADMTEKKVIDTCIPTRNLTVAWSPSSKQFAMVEPYDSKRQVQIFDLDRWARYVVAYHSGSVIGWRADN